MIAGDRCTRACGFCSITTSRPLALDTDEPARTAEAVSRMNLKHVVITAVARDDLKDGGAGHFFETVQAVRTVNSAIIVEVLVPDFLGRDESIDKVLAARPNIFNHNMETVRRLTPRVRSRSTYDRSLSVLRKAKAKGGDTLLTKSGIMLGLGETEEEVIETLRDLRDVHCDALTIGQYLQPTSKHLPVFEYVPPEEFDEFRKIGQGMGFAHVASGPLVRSSYHAEDISSQLRDSLAPIMSESQSSLHHSHACRASAR